MSSVWFDIADVSPDGAGPDLASPWSAAPVSRIDKTEARNRASEEAVAEAITRLREASVRAGGVLGAAGSAESLENAAAVGGEDPLPPPLPAPAAAPLASRALAFVPRLQTAARLLRSTSLSGSPAAAAERIAAALAQACRTLQECEDKFPAAVRMASGRTVNEVRQLLEAGLAELSRASAETEATIGKFAAQQATKADGARTEAERTLDALRGRFLRSEAVVQLRIDVGEAARMVGGAALPAFESLPAHLDALQRAPDAQAVEREAECVLLAFRNFLEACSAREARPSPRAVPAHLLEQIASPARRTEMATMPRERAIALLEHTQRAIGRATSEQEARRLRVVADILEIRARREEDNQDAEAPESAAALRHLHRRWQLRSGEFRRALDRMAESARVTVSILSTSKNARHETVARMRQALARTVADTARRVAAGTSGKALRWREEVSGAARAWTASILEGSRALSEAVLSGLELFVGTGLLVGGGASVLAEEEEDDEDEVLPLSVWQREREMASDRFVASGANPAQQQGPQQQQGSAPTPNTAHQEAAAGSAPHRLLRNVHTLTLSGFIAWIEYAEAVLLANANGTLRAAGAMHGSLVTPRRRFEEMVAAQIQSAQRAAAGSAR